MQYANLCGGVQTEFTVKRLFARINFFITAVDIVIADVGDALFAANDLYIHEATDFLLAVNYACLGLTSPKRGLFQVWWVEKL